MNSRMLGYEYSSPRRVKQDRSFGSPNGTLRNLEGTSFSPLGRSLSNVFRTESSTISPNRSITGPLLTSMSFNSNLSTYMDSKSPGLAERVVQYKNEAQKPCMTHQTKYGSPGIFPVVHLSKKNIPTRTILPNHKVTVRLAAPDIYQPYKSDYKTSESFNQSYSSSDLLKGSGDGLKTHNVLDALRKLSRKRIHSTDEYSPGLNNKRRCSEIIQTEAVIEKEPLNVAEVDDEDVPCVISAMNASLTSSNPEVIRKLNGGGNNPIAKYPKRQQCTIETQTDPPEPPKKVTILSDIVVCDPDKIIKESKQIDKHKVELPKTKSTSENLVGTRKKRFQKLSYEDLKKEKLLKYLSAFPSDTATIPPPQKVEEPKEVIVETKSIPSIISNENKSKHDKHVTFDLPEKEVSNFLKTVGPVTSPVLEIANNQVIQKPEEVKNDKLQTFGEFSAPIVIPTIQKDLFKPPMESKTNSPMSTSPKLGGFKFDFKSDKPVNSTSSPTQVTNLFNIPSSTSTVNPNNSNTSVALNSPQLGANTNVTSAVTQGAIFSTGLEITSPIKGNTTSTDTFLPSPNKQSSAFVSVVNSKSNTSTFKTPTFGVPITTTSSNADKLNFPTAVSTNNPFTSKFESPSNLFATPTTVTPFAATSSANSNNTFVFGGGQMSFNEPDLGVKQRGFGKTSSHRKSFTSNDGAKSNTFTFGETSKQSTFGETSKQSTFGNKFTFGGETKTEPVAKAPVFEVPTTTKPQMDLFKFGSSNTSGAQTFESPPPPSLFSAPSMPSFNAAPALLTNPPPFNSPSFNAPAMPLFNNSSLPNPPPAFNSPPLPNPPPSFNATVTAAPATGSIFNSAPNMFGSVPNTMFGTTPNTNFNASNFNNGAPPQFGAVSSSGMFNIGSGSSTPRSRTTLKARRRT